MVFFNVLHTLLNAISHTNSYYALEKLAEDIPRWFHDSPQAKTLLDSIAERAKEIENIPSNKNYINEFGSSIK